MTTSTSTSADACTTPIPTDLVPYRITICGLRELMIHAEKGVSHVVTILDPSYPDPEVFEIYPRHQRVVWRFDDHVTPVDGAVMPDEAVVDRILDLGESFRAATVEHLLIHCHAGVSRSTATAAILMAQFNPGREEDVFDHLRRIRPRSWPNSLLIAMADDKLGRDGALVAAMARHHDMITRAHPDLAEYLRIHGRAHEVRYD
ncbi:protein-tyrosine-phosphatase [Caenispirillum bisanense]|uniref:tyrosine phosphatase family protein n=1 Tax=Caenispirillum bisanense TaxID=414052 RepID=UPI0031DAA1B0